MQKCAPGDVYKCDRGLAEYRRLTIVTQKRSVLHESCQLLTSLERRVQKSAVFTTTTQYVQNAFNKSWSLKLTDTHLVLCTSAYVFASSAGRSNRSVDFPSAPVFADELFSAAQAFVSPQVLSMLDVS